MNETPELLAFPAFLQGRPCYDDALSPMGHGPITLCPGD